MHSMELTQRQTQIRDFIEETQRASGVSPSTREIQRHFGFASRNAVTDHLAALKKKGAIRSDGGKARSITIPAVHPRAALADIPLYGSIAAGIPETQQQENDGFITIDFESLKISRNTRAFALKVRGDSMVNAGIYEWDTVVLEFREPREKDIVAALIDGETTLKRYVVQGGKAFLKAENTKYKDLIPVEELIIQGVVKAVLRVLK